MQQRTHVSPKPGRRPTSTRPFFCAFFPSPRPNKGFALVVTVSLMALLTVIALGFLSLSAIALRSGSRTEAHAEARANARLALDIAIGELQKQLGPDQRISANGAITAETPILHPHWTGVWDSWVAGDPAQATVGADYPAAASHHSTIGARPDDEMRPEYANKDKHFRAWLLSLSPEESASIDTARSLSLNGSRMPDKNEDAVQLVGKGSLGTHANNADFVSARLLNVASPSGGKGRYGWWIGDESQKARLMDDSYTTDIENTVVARLSRHQAPGSMGTRTLKGLENITTEEQLAALPSLQTISLVDGATSEAALNFHKATPFSYQVLADVREGGLKRDLSTLLERPILLSENSDEFMLYKFNDQERVPIQDLAAFFQLYKPTIGDSAEGNQGVQYASTHLASGIQIGSPDYGRKTEPAKFRRHYTSLYRSPVPVKIQFLLGMTAVERTPSKITAESPYTHKLQLSVTPAVTFWNPTNLPMVMETAIPLDQRITMENMPINIRWIKNGGEYKSNLGSHIAFAFSRFEISAKDFLFKLRISPDEPLRFEPGEVKVLSIPYAPGNIEFRDGLKNIEQGWDPEGLLTLARSDRNTNTPHVEDKCLLFKAEDQIQYEITADNTEIWSGGAMYFHVSRSSYQVGGQPETYHFHHYGQNSREGVWPNPHARSVISSEHASFNENLMTKGFPGGTKLIDSPPRLGSTIINNTESGDPYPFMQFALMAGVETRESTNGGALGGRKFASRPFLHSTTISPCTIDSDDANSFYHYGWNWWIEDINSVLEANVQTTADGKGGYYGGGYSSESGATHVVQQEIPVIPPLSIASLSHTHLGGFSLATAERNTVGTMATGKGGLFPHTLQAVGNSYAHPLIPAGQTNTDHTRTLNMHDGAKSVVLADHSYLANKALWDEFFFSSITPQPAVVEAFGGEERSAREVATDFFFDGKPLPNRRISPLTGNFNEAKLNELFDEADVFGNGYQGAFGLADKIAAHLLVEGPFNINSTSVDAWRALLSSLKGKPVAYLDKNKALAGVTSLDVASTSGTPVSAFTMPNAQPGSATSIPNDPGQWLGSRELTNDEINELAASIVRQVKLRGPFLSLSEFINRRLDASQPQLSAKGALQAALDAPSVSINDDFLGGVREFSDTEKNTMTPAFPEALDGPVAYGSAAYVDQADLLRNFAAQLTPRGDTFVIRTYGDSLDDSGAVIARAWCEAILQRIPEYLDSAADEPHEKTRDLTPTNKTFGRRFQIISFRWLHPNEV